MNYFGLAGFTLFLGFLIDRVHHYLQKLINLRSNAGTSKEELENLKKKLLTLKKRKINLPRR
ncbi:putative B-cell receptor-associated protein 29/31 [Lupinus albus]|uniref:Putative B-cell receptor-associated protein 29/31 n=1 Tax=Lupinus albus TaxID=3870 RepID=A0A6A4NRN3_LUPAL|nr:putative B-cell receptor-associated protein 29/31 [Lupinus albus]